jgi:hypothetical protein
MPYLCTICSLLLGKASHIKAVKPHVVVAFLTDNAMRESHSCHQVRYAPHVYVHQLLSAAVLLLTLA